MSRPREAPAAAGLEALEFAPFEQAEESGFADPEFGRGLFEGEQVAAVGRRRCCRGNGTIFRAGDGHVGTSIY